jgi:hypothetical protein
VLFRTRRRDECSGLKKVGGVAFEKAVRRKPLARWTRDLCKLNGVNEGVEVRASRQGRYGTSRRSCCEDESMAEMSLDGDRKKRVGWNRDTLRRDAQKRADSAVCGRVGSCSRG